MALVSADSRIAELLTELHQLIKQTQVKSHSPPLVEGIVGCDTELWRGQGWLCSKRLDVPEPQWCHEGERRSMEGMTAVPTGFSVTCRISWFFLVSNSNIAILSYIHIRFTHLRCTVQFESNIQSVVQPSPSSSSEHFQKSPVPSSSHFLYASTSLFQVNRDTLIRQNIPGMFRGYFPKAGQGPTLFWNAQHLKTLACWINP